MQRSIAVLLASTLALAATVGCSASSSSSPPATGSDAGSADGASGSDGCVEVRAGAACSPDDQPCALVCGESAVCAGGQWQIGELPCTGAEPPPKKDTCTSGGGQCLETSCPPGYESSASLSCNTPGLSCCVPGALPDGGRD